MTVLRRIATASPPHRVDNTHLKSAVATWLANDPDSLARFGRVLSSAGVATRHFVLSPEEILSLGGLQQRAAIFEEYAPALGIDAAQRALGQTAAKDVGTLIYSSCSVPTIPSIDALILEGLGLERTTLRVPVYQHGCAGGIFGLRLAHKLCRPGAAVLTCAVELCSLVFHNDDHTGQSVVASAIFGDGAASALLTDTGPGLEIVDTFSFLIPGTRDQMGYDAFDDGPRLRLKSELPQVLSQNAPACASAFLERNHLTPKEVGYWLFHPGGVKILKLLEETIGLTREQTRWSWDTLSRVGNMSSATVLFVLESFMREKIYKPGDYVLLTGVGPGLTLELILFQVRG